MVRPRVTLEYSEINNGNPVRVFCNSVRVAGQKNNTSRATPSRMKKSTGQTVSVEPLTFVLQGFMLTGEVGSLSYSDVLKLYRHKFSGENVVKLRVRYADGVVLTGVEGDEDIVVLLDSFNFPIDVGSSYDAKVVSGGSLTFRETDDNLGGA